MDPNNPYNSQPPVPTAPTPDPSPPVEPTSVVSDIPTAPTITPVSPAPQMPSPAPTWPLPPITPAPAPVMTPDPTPPVMPQPVMPEPIVTPPAMPDNSFTPMPTPPTENQTTPMGGPPPWAAGVADSAPTDLSQLIGTPSVAPTPPPAVEQSAPEAPAPMTTVSATPEVMTNDSGKGFPKWMIFAGLGIVLLVAGASAYFILGIGKNSTPEPTTSLPAEQQPLTNPPRAANPSPSAVPEASSSATFGQLQGSTLSAQPAATASATSSIELLKQRNGIK